MKQLLSIWLVPQSKDEEYLKEIINNLGEQNNSPIFIPHLTLFGDILIELEDLKNTIEEVFKNIKPFKIKKTKLNQSELFFKTIFIEFKLNENLKNLFETLSQKTDKRDISTFKPHISLIYKLMPEEEKLKIIDTLNIKEEFIIDRAYIVAPKEGDTDFLNVEGWRSLYKKSFT